MGLCGKESSALKSRLVRNMLVEMPYGCRGHEDRCLQDPVRKVGGRAEEAGTEVVRATESGAGLHRPSLEALRFRF